MVALQGGEETEEMRVEAGRVADPIAHWIDDDCWRPPSLPRTTYRTLRTFGGHTIPMINQHSIDRYHRSARWFAHNRRGGRSIVYHRHVGPVLARDWSTHMLP